jgi:hypothetical protein
VPLTCVVIISVACDSCRESTAVAVWEVGTPTPWGPSAISTSCNSRDSGEARRPPSLGTTAPLFLRAARFSGFSGADTAGKPNKVVCFLLSFFCPRPFTTPAARHRQRHIVNIALLLVPTRASLGKENKSGWTNLSTCPFRQLRLCQRSSRSCVMTCCSDDLARTDSVTHPLLRRASLRMGWPLFFTHLH